MRAGARGECQRDGYCSFADDDCASGQAYGEHAPSGLAGTCVAGSGDGGSGSVASGTTGVVPPGRPSGATTNDPTADTGSSGLACPPLPDPLPAFPGAQGFGAQTVGGRGGALCRVTNLDDAGDGSLRDCLQRSGPRIVVFDTGGTVVLESEIRIQSPFLTVAGQTAPGGGIAVRAIDDTVDWLIAVNTHDVVLRHLRLRYGFTGGWPLAVGSGGGRKVENVVLDHLSLGWAGRALFLTEEWSDVTVQWSAMYEGFSTKNGNGQALAVQYGAEPTRLSLHHNLLAHAEAGMPRLTNAGPIHVLNNSVRNWGPFGTLLSAVHVNLIGNVWERGVDSSSTRYAIGAEVAPGSIFVRDNIAPFGVEGDDWSVVGDVTDSMNYWTQEAPRDWQARAPWPSAPIPVEVMPAAEVVTAIAEGAGATLPMRDEADERVAVGGGMIVSEVPQWPTLDPGQAPLDGDGDGMPDAWEEVQGLDPTSAATTDADSDDDGYPDLEEYLNATDPRSCHSPG